MYIMKSEVVESKGRKLTVKVVVDEHCDESPRDWDNMGTMALAHRRYRVADESKLTMRTLVGECDGWEEVESRLRASENIAVILPVYMYDHSGVILGTSPFGCRWDSGQLGFIYATGEAALASFGEGWTEAEVVEALKHEVSTYSAYLNGEVYGYIIEDETGEHLDSCWGFMGDHMAALFEGRDAAQYV